MLAEQSWMAMEEGVDKRLRFCAFCGTFFDNKKFINDTS